MIEDDSEDSIEDDFEDSIEECRAEIFEDDKYDGIRDVYFHDAPRMKNDNDLSSLKISKGSISKSISVQLKKSQLDNFNRLLVGNEIAQLGNFIALPCYCTAVNKVMYLYTDPQFTAGSNEKKT